MSLSAEDKVWILRVVQAILNRNPTRYPDDYYLTLLENEAADEYRKLCEEPKQ